MHNLSTNSRLCLWLLILAAGVLYLLGNSRVALWDRDEPRYAMASRWMLSSGDWVVPRVGWGMNPQTPRTAKPPLVYWCQAAAMKIFGPTVFAARLPSAVAMILTLIVLAGVLGRFFPQHAFWTLLIFATSVLTIIAAKMCVIDSVQLLWITICQLCLYAMWRGHSHLLTLLTFGLALGLAGLAKGPVAWGVLATTLVVLWLLRPKNKIQIEPQRHRGTEAQLAKVGLRASVPLWLYPLFSFFIVAIIAIAIPLPWLILVHHRSPEFLSRIVGHDLLQRMHEPIEGHKGPPGFYLLTIFGTFYPWSLFLPLAIVNAWRHRDEPAIRFALAATIGPWIMFECISTKMVHYLLPVFPPLAFLLADALIRYLHPTLTPSPGTSGEGGGGGRRIESSDHLTIESLKTGSSMIQFQKCPHPNPLPEYRARGPESIGAMIPRWAISIWAIITTAIATALLLPDRWFIKTPLWPGIVMVVAGLAYAIIILNLFWKNRIRAAVLAMGIGFGILAALLFAFYLPTASFLRISPNLAAILNANHANDAGMVGYEEQSLAFYDAGQIDTLPKQGLHQNPFTWPMYIVISEDVYQRLPAAIQNHLTIIGRTTGINYSKSIKPIDVLVTRKTPADGLEFLKMGVGAKLRP